VRHEAEHTFSAKNLIYHKSIQAAHELMFVPGFNTMRLSFSMQLDICLLHFRSYPGSILTCTGSVCAVLNYRCKGRILSQPEFISPQYMSHTLADPYLFRKQYASLVWCIP